MKTECHKIQTVFKRDPATKHKTLLEGQYSLPEFEVLKNHQWQWEEKVDGTNIRVHVDENGPIINGRTNRAEIPNHLMETLVKMFDCEEFCALPKGMVLYGEGYGPKIQKGGDNYRDDASFVLFDVFINGIWLTRESKEGIAKILGIDCVPIVGQGTLSEMIDYVKTRPLSRWGRFESEGVIARPLGDFLGRDGKRIITKLKCKDFNKELNK